MSSVVAPLVWGNLKISLLEMALLTLCLVLLLCSMSPLLHASNHDGVCLDGEYCPAGVDCISNSSHCVMGECNATASDACITGSHLVIVFALAIKAKW